MIFPRQTLGVFSIAFLEMLVKILLTQILRKQMYLVLACSHPLQLIKCGHFYVYLLWFGFVRILTCSRLTANFVAINTIEEP